MSQSTDRTDTARRPVHPASIALAAVGCLGIGAMIGGWAAEQPANRRNAAPAARGEVTGLAVDSRSNFLYRTFADGRVERLVLGQGVTQQGTTAEWQPFKAP